MEDELLGALQMAADLWRTSCSGSLQVVADLVEVAVQGL